MSADFVIHRDGWLNSSEDDAEARTITRLRICIRGEQLTRNIGKRDGGESEAINTSLLPLAEFLSSNWWQLLYEPLRPSINESFRIRHRLDSGMRGYAFPPIALWSAGDSGIAADWASFNNPFSTISFLSEQPDEPAQLDRAVVEECLLDLVETTLERAKGRSDRLRESWDRTRNSIADAEELSYCIAAGRLGLDPYDPDGPDITELADGISESLFGDVCEIMEVQTLGEAAGWLSDSESRLKVFPETEIGYFGAPAVDQIGDPAWVAGKASAQSLRANTGVSVENPRAAIDDILGGVIAEGHELDSTGPNGVMALVQNLGSSARIGTVAKSARQRRFRACAAAYMAWTAQEGEDRAATEASTRRQQASRAFAAEMLAPQETLIGRAPKSGYDGDDLENFASEFICPFETVMWQAIRADIPLRGIEIPRSQRTRVVTEKRVA